MSGLLRISRSQFKSKRGQCIVIPHLAYTAENFQNIILIKIIVKVSTVDYNIYKIANLRQCRGGSPVLPAILVPFGDTAPSLILGGVCILLLFLAASVWHDLLTHPLPEERICSLSKRAVAASGFRMRQIQ